MECACGIPHYGSKGIVQVDEMLVAGHAQHEMVVFQISKYTIAFIVHDINPWILLH